MKRRIVLVSPSNRTHDRKFELQWQIYKHGHQMNFLVSLFPGKKSYTLDITG